MATGTAHALMKQQTLTVSTSQSADIIANSSAIQTIHRTYAKRYGNLVIFSFVVTMKASVPTSTTIFTISDAIRPASQVDYLLLAGASSGNQGPAVAGQLTNVINTPFTSFNGGTLRGEIVWVIE